jgi:hypothetical protein
MARPAVSEAELIERYGPHLNEMPPGGWDAGIEVDRVVETHCCFCGQQCGIELTVHGEAVVGFEPWYEFPFNEGKLCPKGVKRYLQGSHPELVVALTAWTITFAGLIHHLWRSLHQPTGSEERAAQARPIRP